MLCLGECKCPWSPEEIVGSPGAGVIGCCKLLNWVLELGPSGKADKLLTTELSLMSHYSIFKTLLIGIEI